MLARIETAGGPPGSNLLHHSNLRGHTDHVVRMMRQHVGRGLDRFSGPTSRGRLAVVEEAVREPGGLGEVNEPVQRGLVVGGEFQLHRFEHSKGRLIRAADEQAGAMPAPIPLASDVVFAELLEQAGADRSEELHIDVAVEKGPAHAFPAGLKKEVHLPGAGLRPSGLVERPGRTGLVLVLDDFELELIRQRIEKVLGVHRSMRGRERGVQLQCSRSSSLIGSECRPPP